MTKRDEISPLDMADYVLAIAFFDALMLLGDWWMRFVVTHFGLMS
jgi:hypothetical protein